jgi:hypothetical protein
MPSCLLQEPARVRAGIPQEAMFYCWCYPLLATYRATAHNKPSHAGASCSQSVEGAPGDEGLGRGGSAGREGPAGKAPLGANDEIWDRLRGAAAINRYAINDIRCMRQSATCVYATEK